MKKTLGVILALVALTAGATIYHVRGGEPARGGGPGFTVRYVETLYTPSGEMRETRKNILRVSSTGSFRRIVTDGKTIFLDYGFEQGRGFFTVVDGGKALLRDAKQGSNRTPRRPAPESLMSQDAFVGTEIMHGKTAYRLAFKNNDGSLAAERWIIPELEGHTAKSVDYNAAGGVERLVVAESIEWGEPPADLVKLPDLPVKE